MSETGQTQASPLDALRARMAEGGDFPGLSRTIAETNRTVVAENSRADRITEVILRDVSLTKKLLRRVYAARIGSCGGQPPGLIHADKINPSMQIPPQAMGLLKALRNQATLALRQKP